MAQVAGRSGQPSPAWHQGMNGVSSPASKSGMGLRQSRSSPAALPCSSGCTKAAIKLSRCPGLCTAGSLPAPSSAQARLHCAGIALPAPVPVPGSACASWHSRLWGPSTELLSTGSPALRPEGERKVGSGSGLWSFSHSWLQKRWVSPERCHAGSDLCRN